MPTYVSREEFEREVPFTAADFRIDDETAVSGSDTAWDLVLDRAIDAAERLIEDWLDTTFATTTVSETLHGDDAERDREDLPLPKRPVVSVASVDVEDEDDITVASDIQVVETHIELTDDAPISSWPTGRWNIDVEWTYGYDGAPEPIREGIIRLARNAVEQISTDGLESEATGDGASYNYRPPEVLKAAVLNMTREYEAPSYYSGAMVI